MRCLQGCRPELSAFARVFYARASQYFYRGGAPGLHRISANEGVEQGDAFAPALFAYGVRWALQRAQQRARRNTVDVTYIFTTVARSATPFWTSHIYTGATAPSTW